MSPSPAPSSSPLMMSPPPSPPTCMGETMSCMTDGTASPSLCCEPLMCAFDGVDAYSCVMAETLYHLIPGNNATNDDCGVPDYILDRTGVDPFNGGDFCGGYVTPTFMPAAYDAENENICNGLYVDLNNEQGPQYLAKCNYVQVSEGMYKCKVQDPVNHACA
eukprot:scaffold43995_cov28-Tisochrysis_lutea.AAC.2